MKVDEKRLGRATSIWRASAAALASATVAVTGLIPAPALAITRPDILARASAWVRHRVRYSQSSYFQGYRRDCSGFVSMAWKTGRSYTSSTIAAVAHRIPITRLQPGDAVHTPGHVAIFVKWKNKARGLYVAMEEANWGMPALHAVRSIGHDSTALRYRHLTVPAPATPETTPAPVPGSETSTDSVGTTATVVPTGTVSAATTSSAIAAAVTKLSASMIALFELPASTADAGSSTPAPVRTVLVPLY